MQPGSGDSRAAVIAAIRDADPIELLAMGAPADEYEPEVRTIVPRLRTAATADDVRRIVHEEFVGWFGTLRAGDVARCEAAARAIWAAREF